MKKKIGLALTAAVLVAVTVAGGAVAYFQSNDVVAAQSIDTGVLDVSLKMDCEDNAYFLGLENAVPGQIMEKEMRVTNTQNVALYARVTIEKKFDDVKGNDKDIVSFDASAIQIISNAKENGWIVPTFNGENPDDAEEIVMYYTKPIEAGDSSSVFMEGIKLAEDLGNEYCGITGNLTVITDAVQAFAGKDAIMSEWGVLATIDDSGIITGIEE